MSVSEFAEHVEDSLIELRGAVKVLHLVLNALANALRDSDPQMMQRVADEVTERALREIHDENTKGLVEAYLAVLLHGGALDPDELRHLV